MWHSRHQQPPVWNRLFNLQTSFPVISFKGAKSFRSILLAFQVCTCKFYIIFDISPEYNIPCFLIPQMKCPFSNLMHRRMLNIITAILAFPFSPQRDILLTVLVFYACISSFSEQDLNDAFYFLNYPSLSSQYFTHTACQWTFTELNASQVKERIQLVGFLRKSFIVSPLLFQIYIILWNWQINKCKTVKK